ncbi:nuclease-related domain-containing protein [Streptomyces antarcticus]|uniref:nuclease-related domain-containing protein n=1 Tax=Streptomyces antarcticus TaxID=2996458 RepID=UPI002272273F|nr:MULTISPECIES: nuclease-related domain-containing protein [unclassified Streptomyces]MCY0940288.1 nuclease-related domain-containing protein [Streptomyces sp. H34-AA3]MCZ4088226.1 nuclease-related domain-containing protein [Streptomyces sp. H34-S5]
MRGLRVVPSGRPGHGRLYVNLPDGRAVAWYDRQANRISVLADEQRDAVVRALRPFLTGAVSIGPPPVPTAAQLRSLELPPDADLAPNRPGENLMGELDHGTAGTRARHRLRRDLAAQQRSGDAFDALEARGWRILHCVPLPGLGLIDHLLIGPAGIFCVRTVPARGQRAAVGDLLIAVGRADPRPDPHWARRAAARAEQALTSRAAADGSEPPLTSRAGGARSGSAPTVRVTGALAVDDASRVEVAPTVRDLRVLQPRTAAPDLGSLPTTLEPPAVEALFALARDTRTWLHVLSGVPEKPRPARDV